MLSGLTQDSDIQEDGDFLGGYKALESGIYRMNVDLAYVTISKGGATGLNLVFKSGNDELKTTLWMTSGKAKGGKNFYVDRNGNKKFLPGFNQANALSLLTVGQPINKLQDEEKVINLYDYDAKKEIPTKVAMVTELLGQEVLLGVIKQIVDKNEKQDDGSYKPSGETRVENEVDKIFRASDRMTVTEIKAQVEDATFIDKWADKWTGVERDKSKGKTSDGTTAGAPDTAAKPQKSLFDE